MISTVVQIKTGTAIAEIWRDEPRYKTSEPHCELATYAVMPDLPVFDALGVIQDRLALWFWLFQSVADRAQIQIDDALSRGQAGQRVWEMASKIVRRHGHCTFMVLMRWVRSCQRTDGLNTCAFGVPSNTWTTALTASVWYARDSSWKATVVMKALLKKEHYGINLMGFKSNKWIK